MDEACSGDADSVLLVFRYQYVIIKAFLFVSGEGEGDQERIHPHSNNTATRFITYSSGWEQSARVERQKWLQPVEWGQWRWWRGTNAGDECLTSSQVKQLHNTHTHTFAFNWSWARDEICGKKTFNYLFFVGIPGSASLVYLKNEINYFTGISFMSQYFFTSYWIVCMSIVLFAHLLISPSHRRKASEKPDEVSLLPVLVQYFGKLFMSDEKSDGTCLLNMMLEPAANS